MTYRPYPNPDRARRQIERHDDETPPLAEAQQTDAALREHLATHTPEQFVRVIHDLRAEVARLNRAAEPAPW